MQEFSDKLNQKKENKNPVTVVVMGCMAQRLLENLKKRTADNLSANFDYNLDFIVYGKNGVMGQLEPTTEITSHEIGIIIDCVADTQEHSAAVCSVARSTLLHYGYPGRIATAGNLAFPFSPSDIPVGGIYTFAVYALLEHPDPAALFPAEVFDVKEGEEV